MDQPNLSKKISDIIDSLEEPKKIINPRPFTASSWPLEKEQPALTKEQRSAEIDRALADDLDEDYFNL